MLRDFNHVERKDPWGLVEEGTSRRPEQMTEEEIFMLLAGSCRKSPIQNGKNSSIDDFAIIRGYECTGSVRRPIEDTPIIDDRLPTGEQELLATGLKHSFFVKTPDTALSFPPGKQLCRWGCNRRSQYVKNMFRELRPIHLVWIMTR